MFDQKRSFALKPLKTWLEFHYTHFKEKKRYRFIMRRAPSFFRLKKRNNRIGPNDQQQIDVDTEKKVEMRNIKRRQPNLLTDHLRVRPVASELPDPQI